MMIGRLAEVLPVECVVRGYLSGSGWKEYREAGEVCGMPLPPGLRESDRLPGAHLHARLRRRPPATTTRTSPSMRTAGA